MRAQVCISAHEFAQLCIRLHKFASVYRSLHNRSLPKTAWFDEFKMIPKTAFEFKMIPKILMQTYANKFHPRHWCSSALAACSSALAACSSALAAKSIKGSWLAYRDQKNVWVQMDTR